MTPLKRRRPAGGGPPAPDCPVERPPAHQHEQQRMGCFGVPHPLLQIVEVLSGGVSRRPQRGAEQRERSAAHDVSEESDSHQPVHPARSAPRAAAGSTVSAAGPGPEPAPATTSSTRPPGRRTSRCGVRTRPPPRRVARRRPPWRRTPAALSWRPPRGSVHLEAEYGLHVAPPVRQRVLTPVRR